MHRLGLLERKALLGAFIWTAGIFAIWGLAQLVLNPGVTQEDIRECRAEGIFPPDECADALQALEDEDEPVVGIPLLLILWLAGLLLLGVVWLAEPKPADSD